MKIKLVNIGDINKSREIMQIIGADNIGIDLMYKKTINLSFIIHKCSFYIASILKQEALACGIDACVSKHTITGKVPFTDCLFFGDIKRLYSLSNKLLKQNFRDLREIGEKLIKILDSYLGEFVWFVNDKLFDLDKKFLVMGILNVTPDSFFDGGRYNSLDNALRRFEQIMEEKADIIDIGAVSTRPFSEPVSIDEEKKRLFPILEAIIKRHKDVLLSVDTYNSSIAKEACQMGVQIINDISGLTFDDNMVNIGKKMDASFVIMHTKGKPKEMQLNPTYDDAIMEINDFFENALERLSANGYNLKKAVLDPGIGFGKTVKHNKEIIANINAFKIFGRPILVGASRKSFIGKILEKEVDERLFGTIGANVTAYLRGARIFRVHDVAANREALELAYQLNQ